MFRKTVNDLGLDLVLKTISGFSLSTSGSEAVVNAKPLHNVEQWSERQKQVADVVFALIESETLMVNPSFFPDIRSSFEFIEKEPTASLSGNAVFAIAQFVNAAQILRKIFCVGQTTQVYDSNDIRNIIKPIDEELLYLAQEIEKILEEPGIVKESYPTVKALIEKFEKFRHDRTKTARQMMKTNASVMQADNAVLRDGRIVLPVRNEERSHLEGYVQGSSQTGSTVFMEPFKLVDMNNEVRLAFEEIEIEKARLLKMLSDMVRKALDKLIVLEAQVANADFLYSFAFWVRKNNCAKVLYAENCVCNLIKARHPLLKDKCVPIDLKIDNGIKAVVLTGPNAGGKTVTMKTVGLFALLNQICGYVPASDGTCFPVFDKVFTDIGDDQSIENHLSTFSGHLSSISFILRNMSQSSLVILDELGSGTDPQEGAALARSVLEYCTKKTLLTLTTSHHGVLKQYAYSSDNVLNASMEFDEKTLEPTFKVISGLPGESHAIDTAKRMRLPKTVTASAEKYMGQEAVKISSIIKGLEQKRKEARDKEDEINKRLDEVKKKQKELDSKEKMLLRLENKLKKEELNSFDDYIKESRKKLEGLVQELREGEITKEKTKKVKDHIIELERKKGESEEAIRAEEERLDKSDYEELLTIEDNVELKEGMDVLCGQYRREGNIVKNAGEGKWIVAIGNMKFTFKETDLVVPKRNTASVKNYSFEKGCAAKKPKLNLDLRGYRLLEALDAIDDEIESCCVYGITGFSIVHGYGDGILSTGIHKHLSMNANIAEYHFAHPEDGGQGKTYVKLK